MLTALWQHYAQIGKSAVLRPISSDFYKFYLSAERLRTGLSMYWIVPPREHLEDPCHPDNTKREAAYTAPSLNKMYLSDELMCLGPNLNPPFFMTVMLPLSQAPFPLAWITWASVSSLLAVGAIWILTNAPGRTLGVRLFWLFVGCTTLFAYYPTLANFSMGQLGTMLLFLLALGWQDLRNGIQWRTGIWLGLAIGIKPFVAALLVGIVALGLWRTLFFTASTTALTIFVGLKLFGESHYHDYLRVISDVSWTASNWNGSWFGFFDRYFSSQSDSTWPASKPLSKALGASLSALSLMTLFWSTRHVAPQPLSKRIDTLFMVGVPIMLLVSPLGWAYYFPILAISLCTGWMLSKNLRDTRPLRMGLILGGLMSTVPITLKRIPTSLNPSVWYGVDAWYTYSLVVIVATGILITIRTKKGC